MLKDAVDEFLILQLIGFHPDRRQNSLPCPVDRLLLGDYLPGFILAKSQTPVRVEIEVAALAGNQRARCAAGETPV